MALRLGPLVGLAGLALVLVRMRRLVSPTTEGLPWPLVLIAAVALGVLVIWGAPLVGSGINLRRPRTTSTHAAS